MSYTAWEVGKTYETKGGEWRGRVEAVGLNLPNGKSVVVIAYNPRISVEQTWMMPADGSHCCDEYSLVPPKRKIWINLWIHRDGSPISDAYSNKRKADRDAQDTDACTFNQQVEVEVGV